MNCKQLFNKSGTGDSADFEQAISDAKTEAEKAADQACLDIAWKGCKKRAFHTVVDLKVKQTDTPEKRFKVDYTAAYSCRKEDEVEGAQTADSPCGKIFVVVSDAKDVLTARANADALAKGVCERLTECKKTLKITAQSTDIAPNRYRGTYKCVKPGVEPGEGETLVTGRVAQLPPGEEYASIMPLGGGAAAAMKKSTASPKKKAASKRAARKPARAKKASRSMAAARQTKATSKPAKKSTRGKKKSRR
jgi:hypothetical protein